jgi:hypothetical protein
MVRRAQLLRAACDNHFVAHFGPERESYEDRSLLLLRPKEATGEDWRHEEHYWEAHPGVCEPRCVRPRVP